MANSLYPGYVKFDYHSALGGHSAIVPTLQWSPGAPGSAGVFATHSGGTPANASTMINALADAIAEFYIDSSALDLYTIYTMADATADPLPQYAAQLSSPGVNDSTYWWQAVQTTFSIRTSLFGVMKLILLDAPAPGGFGKITQFSTSPEANAIMDQLSDPDHGWAGRDGGRPMLLSQITYTLNEALRKEYNMT